jgi:hypothetical protein
MSNRETKNGRQFTSESPENPLFSILSDKDKDIAEAVRRDAVLDADPAQSISLSELDSHIQGRRG